MQKPLIAVLMASAFLSLNAQAADLIQVYQQALANDTAFASARASLAAGKERVPQGRSLLLPTVGLNGSVSEAVMASTCRGDRKESTGFQVAKLASSTGSRCSAH